MAKIDFSSGKKSDTPKNLTRWWTAPAETVARDLTSYCAALELAQMPQRFRGYTYHRVATGRAPLSYSMAMPDGVASANGFGYSGDLFDAEFTPPAVNYCALAIDIFANRTWAERPFLEWLPVSDDDYRIRTACKQATAYTDQLFTDLKTWDLVAAMGKDSGLVGTGWIRVGEAGPGQVELTRVDDDSVLLDPTAGENPRAFQIRLFKDREWLIQTFAKGENADVIRSKLENAPGCRLGFFALPVGYQDTLAVIEGWYCARNGKPGRHVIACNDVVLLDEPFDGEEAPMVRLVFEPIAGSPRGRGAVETILPLQREIDRIADNLAQQERVMAWGRAQSRVGNGIEEADLSGNNLIEYAIEPVKFEPGTVPPAQLYARLRELGQDALLSVGLSQQQAQGQASPGVTASVAMQSEMQLSDIRHKSLSLRQEGAVEHLGRLVIAQAAKTKPVVFVAGQQVDFAAVEKALKHGRLRAYPVSGLPQSIPARKQEVTDRLKNGQITLQGYQRLLGLPTTGAEGEEETASLDLVHWQLDKMIETGKFEPVLPFSDLDTAKSVAVKRYQLETRKGLARDRLQLIAQFVAQVQERLDESQPQPHAAPPDGASVPAQPTA